MTKHKDSIFFIKGKNTHTPSTESCVFAAFLNFILNTLVLRKPFLRCRGQNSVLLSLEANLVKLALGFEFIIPILESVAQF